MPINLNQLLEQARGMQEQLQRAQEKLGEQTVTGTAGGGLVVVTANGRGELQRIQIDKQAVDPADIPMLEDLVLSAVNAALRAAQELAASQASALPGMPNLGDLFGGGGFPK